MRIWRTLFLELQCLGSPYLEAVTEPATDIKEVTDVCGLQDEGAGHAAGDLARDTALSTISRVGDLVTISRSDFDS